jgi:hypothetical protein
MNQLITVQTAMNLITIIISLIAIAISLSN